MYLHGKFSFICGIDLIKKFKKQCQTKTAFPKNFVPTLFTNFCAVIETSLITVKLNAASLLGPKNI